MLRAATTLLALLVLGGTGSASAQQPVGAGLTAGAAQSADLTDGLLIAFGLPRIAATNAYFSRAMVVEAVYQATALSGAAMMGRVANTGTLSPGYGGAFQYSPQPSDRLVVHFGGQIHEFVVHEAVGNPQAMTSDAWLLSPHQLRYTHRLGDQAEAEMSVRYDGASFETAVRGWTTQWGKRYELDLRAVGRAGGVRDYGGQDVQTVYDLTGTIRGDGLEVAVNESHQSSLVAATSLRFLPSQRGTASQSNATLRNVLTMDGRSYELRDVQVQMGTRTRGGQGSAGTTGVSGALLRDGQPYGRFLLQGGRPYLQTPDGTIAMDGLDRAR